MREHQGDGSAAEHDQCERGLGGVESVGASGDEPGLVVERLVASVVDLQANAGEDALTVLSDRSAELDERLQAAARRAGAEAGQQRGDVGWGEAGGEDRAERFLERVGAGDAPAVGLQRSERLGLAVGEVLGVL